MSNATSKTADEGDEMARLTAGILRDSPIAMAMATLDGRIVEANKPFCQLLGYDQSEILSLTSVNVIRHDDLAETRAEIALLIEGSEKLSVSNKRYVRKDGQALLVRRTLSLARDTDDNPWRLIIQIANVYDQNGLNMKVISLDHTDVLTGLSNRAKLMLSARHRLAQGPVSLFLMDLDNFKKINTSFNHLAGDVVLVEFARRLLASQAEGEIIARMGGDAFAILSNETNSATLDERSKNLLEISRRSFQVGGTNAVLGVSIGRAQAETGGDAAELLRQADLALHEAKDAGKDRAVVFDPRIHEDSLVTLLIEDALRVAITEERLHVEYQPVYRLADQTIVGFEALCRWNDPVRGVVTPDQFIPIAEQYGLIHELGKFVLRRACTDVASLNQQGHHLSVAVNVSVHQLTQPGFVADVREILALSGLDSSLLTLEITETALVTAECYLEPFLVELQSLGVSLSLDDFGTGFSSLRRLQDMPFQALKIDRSFVSEITTSTSSAPLTSAAVNLGQALGVETIAEGVETMVQYQRLLELGCDCAQGYLLSPPIAFDAARQLVDAAPASTSITAVGHPQRGDFSSSGDAIIIRGLLEVLQSSTDLGAVYVTNVDWNTSVQRVEFVHSTEPCGVDEGLELPWQNTLCRVALLNRTPILDDPAQTMSDVNMPPIPINTYVTVPLQRLDGSTYGTLCGVSTSSSVVESDTVRTFENFAKMICRFLPEPLTSSVAP